MSKRIFILEDDPRRVQWFRENILINGCNYSIAATVEEAEHYLSNYEYDLIFLDHDLKDYHYDAYHPQIASTVNDAETGIAVADFITRIDASPNAIIVIHTMNEPQMKRMRSILHLKGNRYPETHRFGSENFIAACKRHLA